jgi:hypothetical protein
LNSIGFPQWGQYLTVFFIPLFNSNTSFQAWYYASSAIFFVTHCYPNASVCCAHGLFSAGTMQNVAPNFWDVGVLLESLGYIAQQRYWDIAEEG